MMRLKRLGRNLAPLFAVLLLVFAVGCVPVPGGVIPTPAPEEGAPATTPGEVAPPSAAEPIPDQTAEANFRLLISDEKNAIGDFKSLVVTISSVGVHKAGEAGEWIEPPDIEEELDLVDLQGENATEIWSDTLPDGDYNKVFVYVSDINAELWNNDDSTDVKLPSEKLHINTHFSIPDDSPVSFVFDISVVAAGNGAGNGQGGIKYILKPVVGQSGPNQPFIDVSSLGEDEEERERESEEELDLELDGDIAPGEEVTLLVTLEGEPVAGAVVEVNGEEIGTTSEDGTISFTIPEDADKLKIQAELDGQEGELEIGFSGAEMEEEQERESEEELDLELDGDIAPGEEVTLLVTLEGEPVAGAVVEVNGEEIGNTGEDGTISFTIPEDADGLDIEAELDGQEGELEVEL